MLQFLRVRRARRTAIATISPFVETSRRRLNGIPETAWLEPYMIGFMGMLITLIAQRATGPLSTQAMGLVQANAWAEITGMKADLVGEEICFLSSADDQDFAAGCRAAAAFLEAIDTQLIVALSSGQDFSMLNRGMSDQINPEAPATADDRANAAALWSRHFDALISDTGLRSFRDL